MARCLASPQGKCLPNALYVHQSALEKLDGVLQAYEQIGRCYLPKGYSFTLVKFHFDQPLISYLDYPQFVQEAHPSLQTSFQVNLQTRQLGYRDYSDSPNPPILHRKETFVADDYPHRSDFAHLTQQQAVMGLLDESRTIGTRLGWESRLAALRLEIHNHALACKLEFSLENRTPKSTRSPAKRTQPAKSPALPKIDRHKAALPRKALSKPVRLALEANLLKAETTLFDYGCGYGTDIEFVQQQGVVAQGWDPYYQPDSPHCAAEVVNLGYVINVIEDPAERRQALIQAWELTQQVLIVAAQVLISDRTRGLMAYGDGIITSRNTFQKYYEQEELKAYIDQVLAVDAVPVALGIYFVFRDRLQAESFRASRFRSRATTPRINLRVKRFEDYKALLQPLMAFYTERGRLPTSTEIETYGCAPLQEEFGSLKRAFNVILQATAAGEWEAIAEKRRQDLLVYLALSHFGQRPKLRQLAAPLQADIKGLFGTYQQACTAADLMLMSLGQLEIVAEHGRQSLVGQQRPSSLWVHVSALDSLKPLLRLYEGCAARTIGRPNEANLVKFHFRAPKITYLSFPTFDSEPHPALHTSLQVDLRDLQVRYGDYSQADNPPLLHQKEQVILPSYPNYNKFAKLSQQARQWGLFDDLAAIYDRQGWLKCLADHCAILQGTRLIRDKTCDPYKLRLLKAQTRQRQKI